MADIYLNTNTTLGETYDKDGNLMKDYNPVFPYKSQFRVYWQLYTETPGADADGKDMSAWTKANYSGCGALLTCDSNFVHRMTAKLGVGITSGETISSITISDIKDVSLVPGAGYITLVNANAGIKEFYYSAVEISGTTAVCTIGEWTADANYAANSVAKISEEPYFSAAYNASLSNPTTGLFVFDCHVMSRKIAALADEASSRFIDTAGVELLPFKVSGTTYEEMPSFLCDTATVSINMGEAGISPEISGSVDNAILAEIQAMIAEGASVELYNSSTGEWVPYASVTTITNIYTKYRWWLTAAGSDSPKTELPLINGAAAGFGTPTASASLLPAGSSPTASVTASGIDSSKVFSFEFGIPKGDTGDAAGFGTPTASATTLAGNVPATASVSASGTDQEKVFSFQFGIPTGAPAGTVHAFAGDAANIPAGYLLCNGANISRSSYSDLFSAIGTTYGAGDGSTTFSLPDFRGKFLRGYLSGVSAELGTAQGDAIRNIRGSIGYIQSVFDSTDTDFPNTATSSLYGTKVSAYGTVYNSSNTQRDVINLYFDASRNVTTANENRPANYAVNYIIKY